MRRLFTLLAVLAMSLATLAWAHEGHKSDAPKVDAASVDAHKVDATKAGAAKAGAHKHDAKHADTEHSAGSVTGEVVDTGCYLGHEGRGAKHVSCATKCILGGMPMALLTSDGTLYLLTMNHDDAGPYNALKEMAGKTVTVTGEVMERGGMKGIDVAGFKPAVESPPKK